MKDTMPKFVLFVLAFSSALLELVESGGHEHGHHHVIIHVPYKIKTIKHTHTITKHIHHKDSGGDKYEVLGYTVGHPIDLGGHGGHDFGGQGWSGGGGGGGGGHDWSGGGSIGHDWSGGGMSEGIKGGFEGSFDGGHNGGYEAAGGQAELSGHEFSGGFGGHEEYGGH